MADPIPDQLAQEAKRLADEYVELMGMHGTSDYMIVDDGKSRAALHASIDAMAQRIAEMEELVSIHSAGERLALDHRFAWKSRAESAEALVEQYRRDAEQWASVLNLRRRYHARMAAVAEENLRSRYRTLLDGEASTLCRAIDAAIDAAIQQGKSNA